MERLLAPVFRQNHLNCKDFPGIPKRCSLTGLYSQVQRAPAAPRPVLPAPPSPVPPCPTLKLLRKSCEDKVAELKYVFQTFFYVFLNCFYIFQSFLPKPSNCKDFPGIPKRCSLTGRYSQVQRAPAASRPVLPAPPSPVPPCPKLKLLRKSCEDKFAKLKLLS